MREEIKPNYGLEHETLKFPSMTLSDFYLGVGLIMTV